MYVYVYKYIYVCVYIFRHLKCVLIGASTLIRGNGTRHSPQYCCVSLRRKDAF